MLEKLDNCCVICNSKEHMHTIINDEGDDSDSDNCNNGENNDKSDNKWFFLKRISF